MANFGKTPAEILGELTHHIAVLADRLEHLEYNQKTMMETLKSIHGELTGDKKRKGIFDESNKKKSKIWRQERRKAMKQTQEKQLETVGQVLISQCLLC